MPTSQEYPIWVVACHHSGELCAILLERERRDHMGSHDAMGEDCIYAAARGYNGSGSNNYYLTNVKPNMKSRPQEIKDA